MNDIGVCVCSCVCTLVSMLSCMCVSITGRFSAFSPYDSDRKNFTLLRCSSQQLSGYIGIFSGHSSAQRRAFDLI